MAGALLLTQEGDARDHVLGAGGAAQIDTHGRVLVEAVGPGGADARIRLTRRAGGGLRLGPPVVRLLRPQPGRTDPAAGNRPGHALQVCAAPGELSYARVLREPGLLQALVRRAHRERHRVIGACAAAAWTGGILAARHLAQAAIVCAGRLMRMAAALRPCLPSLEETFAARVFLRSRL